MLILKGERGALHLFALLGTLLFFLALGAIVVHWQRVNDLEISVAKLEHQNEQLQIRIKALEQRNTP